MPVILGQMVPPQASLNAAHRGLVNSKLVRDMALLPLCRANLSNEFIREFCSSTCHARTRFVAPPINHVGGILRRCARLKMRGIYARRAVAFMSRQESRLHRAIRFLVNEATHSFVRSIPPNNAVSVLVTSSQPWPASVRAARFVGVVCDALSKRPVHGAAEAFRDDFSHLIAVLSRSLVRVGAAVQTWPRPAFSSKNCAVSGGLSPCL
jgi:hypothetical protein